MTGKVAEINAGQFEELVLGSAQPVILDFYSSECPPCDALAPKFQDLADRFGDDVKFYKIFRQENRELATELGVTSSPTLLFFKGGKEAAERLSGGIRKGQILEGLSRILPADLYGRLSQPRERKIREVELAILGGGPAGLTAAIYGAQAKLDTLVIDPALPGGQVKITHTISNYPGTEKPLAGWELAHRMETQARESGADILAAVDINEIDLTTQPYRIVVDNELEIRAPALVLAMGAEPRALGMPGEKELRGQGISYCATCDGKYYEQQDIMVIGGGNSAIEEALYLTRFASRITVVHQFDHLQANKTAQERALAHPAITFLWNNEPRSFEKQENGRIKVTLENIKTGLLTEHETAGVFVFVGMQPNTSAVKGELTRNQWGYILTNDDMETNYPGVFAAGDIRDKKIRQAVTAVSDGCIAAVMAEKYLESSSGKNDAVREREPMAS